MNAPGNSPGASWWRGAAIWERISNRHARIVAKIADSGPRSRRCCANSVKAASPNGRRSAPGGHSARLPYVRFGSCVDDARVARGIDVMNQHIGEWGNLARASFVAAPMQLEP